MSRSPNRQNLSHPLIARLIYGRPRLSFAFDVPSSTATFQRCAAGRTRHYGNY